MVTKSDLRVGAFVLLGLFLATLVIFLIGDERRLFASSVTYHAQFDDVQGLNKGAPVRMGGVRIGHVSSVRYSDDPADPRVYVGLNIVTSEARRIRTDSLVQIDNKGFLGDKMVTVTKGEEGELVAEGGWIPSEEPADMLAIVNRVAEKAESAIVSFDSVMQAFADEDLHANIRGIVDSVDEVLYQVTDGHGYPNRLLTDPAEAERISHTLESLDESSQHLNELLAESKLAVRQLRKGPGFGHDVLFGEGPRKEIAQIGQAAEEVAVTLRTVRETESFAHDLLFGGDGDGADVLSNVRDITVDVRDIVRNVKAGKGTIGALLVDPSVYDDLKRVIGNVERNNVLRALVRYSIKADEPSRPVEVSAPSPTVDAPTP